MFLDKPKRAISNQGGKHRQKPQKPHASREKSKANLRTTTPVLARGFALLFAWNSTTTARLARSLVLLTRRSKRKRTMMWLSYWTEKCRAAIEDAFGTEIRWGKAKAVDQESFVGKKGARPWFWHREKILDSGFWRGRILAGSPFLFSVFFLPLSCDLGEREADIFGTEQHVAAVLERREIFLYIGQALDMAGNTAD